MLKQHSSFTAYEAMLEDEGALMQICRDHEPQVIIHLAAQAGVRYSIDNPRSYVNANLVGVSTSLKQRGNLACGIC